MSQLFASVKEVVNTLRPRDPVFVVRPRVLAAQARRILGAFPGDVLYAVKCNDDLRVIDALYAGGLRHFDTASITEVRAITQRYPDAVCHFMHPVKSREAIAEAYFTHGVRSFVLDHEDELDKIFEVTRGASDMTLAVRLEMPRGKAMMCLSGKFGCGQSEGARLLRRVHAAGCKTGLTFHVGSQCVDPHAYAEAVHMCGRVLEEAGVPLHVLDVGGGFPGEYTGEEPAFEAFVEAVMEACDEIGLTVNQPGGTRLQCEPGRALVCDGVSVIARVELRRGDSLFLNDGTYGGLAELRWLGNCFPMRVVRPKGSPEAKGRLTGFDLYGPTCDSIDSMPGPHWLPGDVKEGDWVEVGRMGAYSNALRTRFNGFENTSWVLVDDTVILRPAVPISLDQLRSAA
ncbi:type III PLP-dependent enzyme [Novispirillum sp. DQ9]|uniref:type III PLP-dependent enzyme n=1 Tax=Novispirillum sp. DQ9 TaxID=3398612 RepID=UPI003C7AA8E9